MNLSGGIPVINSRNGPGSVIGKTIGTVASRLVSFQAATVLSDHAAANKTTIGIDVSPSTPIGALSMTGRLAKGQRVMVAFYPPRGCLVLGRIESNGSTGLIALTTPGAGQLFTADMVPAGAIALKIMCQAGGGGGGNSTNGVAGQFSPGAGAAGGHYAESIYDLSDFVFPCEYDIGTGGTATNTGGTTRFSIVGATYVPQVGATGGIGGATAGTGTSSAASNGGTSAGGVLIGQRTRRGSPGGNGLRMNSGATADGSPGFGGEAELGGGGEALSAGTGPGGTGLDYGGGGAGARTDGVGGSQTGGTGGQGAIFIEPIFG